MTSERDEAVRQVAIGQCLYQIENCIRLIDNPRTKPATRARRMAMLEEQVALLERLDPQSQALPGAREQLAMFRIAFEPDA